MSEVTDQFLGYDLTELLKVCTQVHCPKCKGKIFFIFISPDGQNFVFLCHHCGHLPSLDEMLHRRKEVKPK